ncbi:pre-piRNA 3'-exonuclease trimmer-like [Babylonia areolata]|uniref:pre-piRNA 3'-exonuclease trimmer-like n=1 Tax=Babylonia areolata TaxID=304850 RepID=UPI003FD2DDD9
MCEVTKSSFEQLFPLIEKTIKEADFIAIDSEFTGLTVRDNDKPSLFDTSEERYRKIKNSVSRLSLCQIGISAFVRDKDQQSYQAHTYNFPLCPMAFGPISPGFYWQTSSLQFMSHFNFDFNTCVYEGVSFMNDQQERQLCRSMDSGNLFSGQDRTFDESFLQTLCSKVAEWYVTSKEGQMFTLHKTSQFAKLWNEYVIHTEIRRRFSDVWTTSDSFKNIAVEKVSPRRRKEMEEKEVADKEKEPEKMKQTMLGFTRVFRVIREYQKPLVGHNMLMDILFMYDKFFRPLPAKYSTFKRDLHDIFPKIYDTKHMSFSFRKMLQELTGTFSNNLIQLYHLISSKAVTNCEQHMPSVTHAKGFDRYTLQNTPHEAGFDAYVCGYVFIRLCHLERFRNNKNSLVGYCPIQLYLKSAEPFCNHINVIRATVSYICLEGPDPPSKRPQQLFVRCRKRGERLNTQQLAEWMTPCGPVDIRLLSPATAIVAADNFSCARAILSTFKNHKTVAVSKYRFWKHSPSVKVLMWCGLVVSGGVCIWSIVSLVKDCR